MSVINVRRPVLVSDQSDLRQYCFNLSPPAISPDGAVEIEGKVTNLSDTFWGQSHHVGMRNFRTVDGCQIRELENRASFLTPFVPPGRSVFFRASLPASKLLATAASFELDVVHENVSWLSDLGGKAILIELDNFTKTDTRGDWIDFLSHSSGFASQSGVAKITTLKKAIFEYDFQEYNPLVELRDFLSLQGGSGYRHWTASSVSIENAVQGAAERLLEHFSLLTGKSKAVLGEPSALGDNFLGFLKELRAFYGGVCPPLPRSMENWLNSRALPASISSSPASRSMVAALDADQAFYPKAPDRCRDLDWWFATSVLIDLNLPSGLIPDYLKRELAAASGTQNSTEFPALTPFLERLHRDDANYTGRYQVSESSGRCAFAFDILSLSMENEARRHFIGADIFSWLTKPVDESVPLSPFEILLLANTGGAPPSLEPDRAKADVNKVRARIDWLPRNAEVSGFPIRIIGMATSSTGLGANLRMSGSALKKASFSCEIVDTRSQRVSRPEDLTSEICETTRRPFDLFHLNFDEVPQLVARYSTRLRSDTFRACFALWETSAMPEEHRVGAGLVDEIWVPTNFVRDIYENAGFRNVFVVGKGIETGRVTPPPAHLVDASPDLFTFLISFDVGSWVDRKNPAVAVEAFEAAFVGNANVRLIIKTNGLYDHPGDRNSQIERIRALAASDERITIVSDHLSFDEYLGLIKYADATVSPHRCEGFGYLAAHSLLMETPVIATDYSGTTDFCNSETSFPVDFQLRDVKPGDFVYTTPGAKWAEIKFDHLVSQMRVVYSDRTESHKRTMIGKALIERKYSMSKFASVYRERILTACGN